jgi:hypothetical protein
MTDDGRASCYHFIEFKKSLFGEIHFKMKKIEPKITSAINKLFAHELLDKMILYDGQDRSQNLGGRSSVQEDGNREKGW